MLPELDSKTALESTNSVVKSFFRASGPGQSAAAQTQSLEFLAYAQIPGDKVIVLRGMDIYIYIYIYVYIYILKTPAAGHPRTPLNLQTLKESSLHLRRNI